MNTYKFSHSLDCCFEQLMVCFALPKVFCFMRFHLLLIILSACAIIILCTVQKVVSCTSELKDIHNFLFYQGHMSGFMLRSLIHLDLNFVGSDKYGTIWILLNAVIQFWHHLSKMLPLFQNVFLDSLLGIMII